MRLVDRIVEVNAPLTDTWQTLIDAESWPTWMPVRSVETSPKGKVDRNTSATIRWNSGRPMQVVVTEFRPGRSFRWSGRLLGSTVSYDHVVTASQNGAEVLFILEVVGPTARVVAGPLRRAYERALDEAFPDLQRVLGDTPH